MTVYELHKLYWLVLCQVDTARVTLEEGTSCKKMLPLDWPVGKPVVHFLG